MAGLVTEAYQAEFVGQHAWQVPIFLFREHDDVEKYLWALRFDPERVREIYGRHGTDFVGIALNGETAQERFNVQLTGTEGRRRRYNVIPIADGDSTRWLDPAGFELAVSVGNRPEGRDVFRSDFELRTAGKRVGIVRAFRPA